MVREAVEWGQAAVNHEKLCKTVTVSTEFTECISVYLCMIAAFFLDQSARMCI